MHAILIFNRCRRAFSLIELVIVLLVMSIFAAVSAPAFIDSLLFGRVESAARRLKADLELVRQTARLKSASQTLTFAGTTYTTSTAIKNLDRPQQINSVNLAATPYELTAVLADFGGQQTVTFDGYGTPSAGGNVVLRAINHECTVTLDAISGEVTITSNHPGGGAP